MADDVNDENNWISEALGNGFAFTATTVFYSIIIFAVLFLLPIGFDLIESFFNLFKHAQNEEVFINGFFSMMVGVIKIVLLGYCELLNISVYSAHGLDSSGIYYLIPPIILVISGFTSSSHVKGIQSVISGTLIGLPYAIIMVIVGIIGSIDLFHVGFIAYVKPFEVLGAALVYGIIFGGIGGVIGSFTTVDLKDEES